MIPSERQIEQVQRETGMGRMQAINHLRCRAALQHEMRQRPGRWAA